MKRILTVVGVALVIAAMVAASALPAFAEPLGVFPGPGNSGAAHACQDLKALADLGLVFKNQGECVSFFAHGGKLPPPL